MTTHILILRSRRSDPGRQLCRFSSSIPNLNQRRRRCAEQRRHRSAWHRAEQWRGTQTEDSIAKQVSHRRAICLSCLSLAMHRLYADNISHLLVLLCTCIIFLREGLGRLLTCLPSNALTDRRSYFPYTRLHSHLCCTFIARDYWLH